MKVHGRREVSFERLEKRRQAINERVEYERLRLNEQIDRKEAKLSQRLNHKQAEIVAAALILLDKEGLTSLSLRKLATVLDMQAPGLYWYFKNKEMLIDYLAEEILNKDFKDLQPRLDNEPWQDWLSATMNRLRKAMLAHKDGARVVAGAHLYPAVTLAKIFELAIGSLHEAGLNIVDARHIIMTASTYTFGFVIEEQASPSMELIGGHIDDLAQDYPATAESIRAALQANPTHDNTHEFNAGLKLIINGAKK
jgi:TetR/AcrR family tetracycline transcriptional repressor